MRRAIDEDIAAYPELAGKPIAIGAMSDEDVFFQSRFTFPYAYVIDANPRAFAAGIDDVALHGVIGHELAHTRDYETRSALALLPLIGPALFPSSSTWERGTDLVAIERGFGPGLLHYRAWLFRVLDAAAVREKRAIYYSPLEIDELIAMKRDCPAQLARLVANPPLHVRPCSG